MGRVIRLGPVARLRAEPLDFGLVTGADPIMGREARLEDRDVDGRGGVGLDTARPRLLTAGVALWIVLGSLGRRGLMGI